MSVPRNESEWEALYRQTIFQVKDFSGNLVCFTANSAEQYPFLKKKKFAVVTAFNPMNRKTSLAENMKSNALLEADLIREGYLFYATDGALDGHLEKSFTIEGISETQAVEIGLKYRQHAILYNDDRGVRFVRCRLN